MPGARDKLLLNSGNLAAGDCAVEGNACAIQEQFATADILAQEIEKAGLIGDPEALTFRDDLERICYDIDSAQDTYIAAQIECRKDVRIWADKLRRWFDDKQFPPKP